MRATHTAGGYLCIDPSSPPFIRDDCIFIPACFVSYDGKALDEKTPLLRAHQAVSNETARLFKHLGYSVGGAVNNIGLEQELFFIPRGLQADGPPAHRPHNHGGRCAPRGQELCDHYMGPPNHDRDQHRVHPGDSARVLHDGHPAQDAPHARSRPTSTSSRPLFGTVITQIDQNLMVMQIAEEVAARHGLAVLPAGEALRGRQRVGEAQQLVSSPPSWRDAPTPVTSPRGLTATPALFPIVMSALVVRDLRSMAGIISAVDPMATSRMAIASPGNDFRLGAMEAPPAISRPTSATQITAYLEGQVHGNGDVSPHEPNTKTVDLGIPSIAPFTVPAEDRNRTSPFPYGGHRFEFRAVGSSQNAQEALQGGR